MSRLACGVVLALLLWALAVAGWAAQAAGTELELVFAGELSPARRAGVVRAAPGVRMGLELAPRGLAKGAQQVLDVRLRRPGAPEGADTAWAVLATGGQNVLCVYEFAYPWEVDPGEWVMSVYSGGVLLVRGVLAVEQGPALAEARPEARPEARDEPKPDAKASKTDARQPAKPAEPKQEAKPQPKAEQKPEQKAQAEPKASAEKPRPDAKPQSEPKPQAEPKPQPAPQPAVEAKPKAAPASPPSASPPSASPPPVAAPKPAPGRVVGGDPQRQVFALVAGTFSEESRALWMSALLRGKGVQTCVRAVDQRGGKPRWQLLAGWKESRAEADKAKAQLTPALGEVIVAPMRAGELEKGLRCR